MAYGDNTEFDLARSRAKQQAGADIQQKRDVLMRRQAQLGGGPGGAFVAAEQGAIDASQAQLANANEGIDTAQRAEQRRISEIEAAQKYGTSEREASQAFAAQQTAGQQAFATGERAATQAWQQGNLDKDRLFQDKQFNRQGKQLREEYRKTGVLESQVKLENIETAKTNRLAMIKNAGEYGMSPEGMIKALDNLEGITIGKDGLLHYPDGFNMDDYRPEAKPVARSVPLRESGQRGRGNGGYVVDQSAVKRRQQRGGRY